MSAEDCILYRKIDDGWWIIPLAFTFDDWDDRTDAEFKEVAFRVPECIDVFGLLCEIAKGIDYTEHGILYSCPTREDAPPEVPSGHKWLLMPSGFGTTEHVND